MIILYAFGSFRPVWRARIWQARIWAVKYIISLQYSSGDFRWALAALALRSLAGLEALLERQLVSLARKFMTRAWRGACLAAALSNADTTVAAGRG